MQADLLNLPIVDDVISASTKSTPRVGRLGDHLKPSYRSANCHFLPRYAVYLNPTFLDTADGVISSNISGHMSTKSTSSYISLKLYSQHVSFLSRERPPIKWALA